MLSFLGGIYFTFLYQPTYNLVILLYDLSPEPKLAWAIIILALLVRVLFLIFTLRGFKTDALLKEITPTVRAIEADNSITSTEKRKKITDLMREKGINPMSEIYSLLGQLLFLLILYQIVQSGLTEHGITQLYSFIPHPSYPFDKMFFGYDITIAHNYVFSGAAATILFFEQLWEYEDKKDMVESTFSGKWYPLLLPISTFILLMLLPATKAIFIGISVLFSIGIRIVITLARRGKE